MTMPPAASRAAFLHRLEPSRVCLDFFSSISIGDPSKMIRDRSILLRDSSKIVRERSHQLRFRSKSGPSTIRHSQPESFDRAADSKKSEGFAKESEAFSKESEIFSKKSEAFSKNSEGKRTKAKLFAKVCF